MIEAAGCRLLFLPPNSPDLNPIDAAWSMLTTLLGDVGARTTEAFHAALTTLVDATTMDNAAGYFWDSGYGVR